MKTVKVRIAVGMWQNPKTKEWCTYCEGWAGGDPKSSAEEIIYSNGFNNGAPVYWRYVEADVPVPQDHEVTVQGQVETVKCSHCNGRGWNPVPDSFDAARGEGECVPCKGTGKVPRGD